MTACAVPERWESQDQEWGALWKGGLCKQVYFLEIVALLEILEREPLEKTVDRGLQGRGEVSIRACPHKFVLLVRCGIVPIFEICSIKVLQNPITSAEIWWCWTLSFDIADSNAKEKGVWLSSDQLTVSSIDGHDGIRWHHEHIWLTMSCGCWRLLSQSPKAGHPKAGRSDFRNQRFKPNTAKMRKMRTSLPAQENKGLRRLHRTKTRKMRKMRTRKRGKCGKCGWLALMWLALGDPHAEQRKMRLIVLPDWLIKWGNWGNGCCEERF